MIMVITVISSDDDYARSDTAATGDDNRDDSDNDGDDENMYIYIKI